MVGAFLGWKMVVLTFVLSSLLGGIIGIIVIASRRG
jgi:prepilin signal peptidase PulO-like enzyme (type II secretory pathway)